MNLDTGTQIHRWLTDLFPICRSLSGAGVRDTLSYIQGLLPEVRIKSVPSGTQVFDWTIPDEWNIKDAYVADACGNRVIDFNKNNLHVVGYSVPIDEEKSFSQLDKHLHSLPELPEAIPYVTSYYKSDWGFCLSERERAQLRRYPDAKYRVKIDSELAPGMLNYGELVIPGTTDEEILLSTYVCHPSMANNELSGPGVVTALAKWINDLKHRHYTYRILFLVETIGAIAYLSEHIEKMKKNTIAGFVVTCVGDERSYSYVASRQGNTVADRIAKHTLRHIAGDFVEYSYLDRGSDERQYCSPGIDLPVCSVCRTKYNEYPEYHTSLDNLKLVTPRGLQGAYNVYKKMIEFLEANKTYRTKIRGEPQLGKRGLYPMLSTRDSHEQVSDMMNLIAYSDGYNSLLDIAILQDVCMADLIPIAEKLVEADILEVTR